MLCPIEIALLLVIGFLHVKIWQRLMRNYLTLATLQAELDRLRSIIKVGDNPTIAPE